MRRLLEIDVAFCCGLCPVGDRNMVKRDASSVGDVIL